MSNDDRNAKLAAAVRSGDSLRVVGGRFGISHERVRQLVSKIDPEAIPAGMRVRAEEAKRLQDERLPELEERVCVVCGVEFKTADRRRITCSSDHAQMWASGLRFTEPSRQAAHKVHVATSYLRRPDHYGEVRVRWAEKYLTDNGHELPEGYAEWKARAA